MTDAAAFAALERRVAALERRKAAPFGLARTTLAPDDSGSVQTVQARMDAFSVSDAIPILFHYGYGSVPPIGTDLHLAYIDGDRSKAVAMATGNQTTRRRGHVSGDVWMDGHGWSIVINAGGLEITGNVQITGDVKIIGKADVTQEVTAKFGGASVTLSQHLDPQGGPPIPGT
jgi:phage gp45-like